jgi:hypothetical protein
MGFGGGHRGRLKHGRRGAAGISETLLNLFELLWGDAHPRQDALAAESIKAEKGF